MWVYLQWYICQLLSLPSNHFSFLYISDVPSSVCIQYIIEWMNEWANIVIIPIFLSANLYLFVCIIDCIYFSLSLFLQKLLTIKYNSFIGTSSFKLISVWLSVTIVGAYSLDVGVNMPRHVRERWGVSVQ